MYPCNWSSMFSSFWRMFQHLHFCTNKYLHWFVSCIIYCGLIFFSEKTFRIPSTLQSDANKKRKHQKDVPEQEHCLVPISDFCTQACKHIYCIYLADCSYYRNIDFSAPSHIFHFSKHKAFLILIFIILFPQL